MACDMGTLDGKGCTSCPSANLLELAQIEPCVDAVQATIWEKQTVFLGFFDDQEHAAKVHIMGLCDFDRHFSINCSLTTACGP
jgi:hypothetical protein